MHPCLCLYNEQTSFLNPFTLAKVYRDDKKAVEEIYKNMDKLLAEGAEYEKNNPKNSMFSEQSNRSMRYETLGTDGDIIVTLMLNSSSSGIAGHAAIVSRNDDVTIESYSKSFSPKRIHGVAEYTNNWNIEPGTLLLRVVNAKDHHYTVASTYAEAQIGKPYNGNFFNKNRTDQFYCSQLVWRAWLNAGFDIEKGTIPNAVIAPADLVNSPNTRLIHKVK